MQSMNLGDFTFLCRTKTGFGMNALEHLPFDLSCMGSQKPLVLLDKDAQGSGSVKPLARAFKESGMTLGICPSIDGTPHSGNEQPADKNGPADDETVKNEIKLLKELYQIYIEKGFDAIIALGTGRVIDMAKALNMAVSLGPDALKTTKGLTQITTPLAPLAYIPTGMGSGMEANGIARFNNNTFNSPFLVPDLAVIDPAILTQDTSPTLINAGLTCLAACCEAHVLSDNPPAKAYAATAIRLIMENLMPMVKSILVPGMSPDKKAIRHHRACLTHASVITGIILDNCKGLLSIQLGKRLANNCTASPGHAMAILLPAVLDLMAKDRSDLDNLALPLLGIDAYSAVPAPQRPGMAIQKIQSLLNELYQISLGTLPRTLGEAGLDREAISSLTQTLFSNPPSGTDILKIDPEQAEAIMAHALDGHPLTRAYLPQPCLNQA